MAIIPVTGASFIGLSHDETPGASIISRVAQQVGATVGTALLAAVLRHGSGDGKGLEEVAHDFGNALWWTIAFTAVAAYVSRVARCAQSEKPHNRPQPGG